MAGSPPAEEVLQPRWGGQGMARQQSLLGLGILGRANDARGRYGNAVLCSGAASRGCVPSLCHTEMLFVTLSHVSAAPS